MTSTMVIGAALWTVGPRSGDKYTELGVSLFTSASVGLGLVAVDRLIARRAMEREEAAAEERRFLASLMARADLTGARLRGRMLSGVMMLGQTLDTADMRGTTLDRVDFRQASLVRVMLDGAEASDANFAKADFRESSALHFSAIESCFDGATCVQSTWNHSHFRDCSLVGVKLFRSMISSAEFTSCVLRQADFGKVEGEDVLFSRSDLRASTFMGAHLLRPDFSAADLRGADLTAAVIEEPNLSGADLRDCRTVDLVLRNPLTDSKTRLPDSFEIQHIGAG